MWIILNNAFLSVVAHRTKSEVLLVRARVAGDIERVFPAAKVVENRSADYRFRAEIPRPEVTAALATVVQTIDYDNFKASVIDGRRHDAYMNVWSDLKALQKP